MTEWSDIVGLEHCKRAIEVAMAGGHSIRFVGPPHSQARDLADYMERGPAHRLMPENRLRHVQSICPCPCGNYGDLTIAACVCLDTVLQQHRAKLALVHFDIEVEVPREDWHKLLGHLAGNPRIEPEEVMLKRVAEALPADRVRTVLSAESLDLLKAAYCQLHLTVKQVRRIVAVAHTIARLARSATIKVSHVAEAVQYRARL